MATLLYIPFSPWSECAKFALECRRVAFEKQRYNPILGEPALRWKLKRFTGPVSVPVLLDGDSAIADSFAIARWGDERGQGASLFPKDHLASIEHWIGRAQEGMSAGRALSLARVLESPDAIDEMTPPPARRLGGVAHALTRAGVVRTRKKYGGPERTDAEHTATLLGVLDELRGSIARGTIHGVFTYADICAAQVLCFVQPHDGPYLRIGPANREVFGDPALAARYADLLAWRDALYDRHRMPS